MADKRSSGGMFTLPLGTLSKLGVLALFAVAAIAAAFAESPLPGSAQTGVSLRNQPIAVLVNVNNPVANISLQGFRSIFSGEKKFWGPSQPILLVMPPRETFERQVVLRVLLQMDETAYRRYWVQRLFRAESDSTPIDADSSEMVKRAVSSVRGAVGTIAGSSVETKYRILQIDGKLPGDPDYPLH